jgi:hypothetical protein
MALSTMELRYDFRIFSKKNPHLNKINTFMFKAMAQGQRRTERQPPHKVPYSIAKRKPVETSKSPEC